ncbi:MAG TPA: hypothetical protein VK168_03605 [Saprospiraceae bacterium]|nr:hypothetical protein [Saprospiraceae bacterium]
MTYTALSLRFPRDLLSLISLLSGLFLTSEGLKAQNCENRITIESGTQQFSCTDVTVTSDGDVSFVTSCTNNGPYHIGGGASGSFTFTFSHPVAGVTLDFDTFDYDHTNGSPAGVEEVTLEINGAFYPLSNAGLPTPCYNTQVILSPSGGLQSPPCPVGSFTRSGCEDLHIQTSISTLTITNNLDNGTGIAGGVNMAIYFCCQPCTAQAGLIPSPPLNLCPDAIATVPPAAPNVLPQGTMLQYILFSDPSDTLGSIVMISNTPEFSFDPSVMQEGITYYIAAIAGNELNGNVDLSDRCLDISNEAVPVIWNPRPTVSFSVNDPDVCRGKCVDVLLEFTGAPPFTLTYTTPFMGPTTKNFIEHTGIVQICIPLNAVAGSLDIQAIKLSDMNCVCE